MVVESLSVNGAEDLREENEDIRKLCPSFSSQDSQAYRLSFFSGELKTKEQLANIPDEQFLGYAIVKVDDVASNQNITRVYESVLRSSSRQNNFIRGAQRWQCSAAGKTLHVSGYLYAQQNGLTNCCAHVALRTVAARFHRDGDMPYREMNKLVGIDHVRRKAGNGLTCLEMAGILEQAGARCFGANYGTLPPAGAVSPPFQKYLYGSVESGVSFRQACLT